MKQIEDLEVLHGILLDMAKEFHRICEKHHIPYYMLGGTMLGAVRHKGFIPWDDDMDFGVPREHYQRLIQALKENLPEQYRMLNIDNSDCLQIYIVKISDSRTYVREKYKENMKDQLGVNIDIFPLDKVKAKGKNTLLIQCLLQIHMYIQLSIQSRPLHKKIIACLLKILFCWLPRKAVINFIDKHLIDGEGEYTANVYGAWGDRETVLTRVMGMPRLYAFEDTQLYGVACSDDYLTSLYGDYMQLPPEEKRHLHLINVFWK